MAKDTPHSHLVAIQNTLQRLQVYQLPDGDRQALQNALQHVEKLHTFLQDVSDQGRLAALGRVSHLVGASLHLEDVLTQLMDAIIELTQAERGFLMLTDSLTGRTELRAARNIEHETLERKDMEISRTVIRTVIETGAGVVSNDAQSDPRFAAQASVIFHALRSILCAPLRVRGQVIGAIYVDNRAQAGVFTEEDLTVLNAFATQAAIAIDNARLYTQTDQALARRVADLETLGQVDRQLDAHLDFDKVMEITQRWAVEGSQASESWIALVGEENPALSVVAGARESLPLSLEDELVNTCLKEASPQSLPAQGGRPALALAAMLFSGKPVGVIIAARPDDFAPEAVQFLDRMAARAASAVQNARLYRAVQDANLAKTKFVSVVTHELRLPMTSIKGYTDLLRQGVVGPVNEMQLNFLNVVRNNVERMTALVSDLSDISRIESGRLKWTPALIVVPDYIQEAISTLRPKIDERQQKLEVNLPADLPRAYADPNRLVQVLTNLLSNANRYTAEGGQITIQAHPEGDFVRIEVSDNGIGISPEDQTQLFTQFFRSEDPAVRELPGWGLGLHVSKGLVELMGGQIGVQSTLKVGSTFWFTLPTTSPAMA